MLRILRLLAPALLILVATATAWIVLRPPPSGRAARYPDDRQAPSDWFFAQRAFPYGTIPADKVDEALAQARLDRRQAALTTTAGTLTWTCAGPFNIGGRVTALAPTPSGATLYLGSAMGGVFKSTNQGINWTPVFDIYDAPSIGALEMSPFDTNTVYVGTGEANAAVDSYDGNGVFRTTDGGATWTSLGLGETRRIGAIEVDPSNPDRIFVAAMGSQFSTGADRGLYRSENGGANWTQVLFVNDSTGVVDIAINPVHPETLYCATWERVRHYTYRRAFGPGCGVWRSIDSGTSWTKLTNGLPASNDDMGRIGLAIAPSRPSTVYAQIVSGSALGYNGLGLYRTLDGGATWTKRDGGTTFANSFGGFGWYFGEIAVSPTNPDVVYTCGQTILRSTDGGFSFSSVTGTAHVDEHALWIDPANPSHLSMGSDGGFFQTTVGGGSWTATTDLPISQFYAGAIDPANPTRLLGGTQDNDCMQTQSGMPNAWSSMGFQADGFQVAVDPASSAITFGEYQYGSYGAGPQRSTSFGSPGTWSSPTGIDGSDRFNWNAPFVISPLDRSTILFGSHRVWRSRNNGQSYSAISPDLTSNNLGSLLVYSTITTLAISPADTTLYYSGSDDGRVYRTQNAGGNWFNVSAGLPVRWVTRVVPDPVNSQVVYATLSGIGMDEPLSHVYRSTNRGTSWTSISSNLPDIPANDLIVDPANPGRLYLATDVGVYTSSDLGGYWYPLGQGMPLQAVVDLSFHPGARKLVAATHGRSQWTLDLNDLPVGVAPAPAAARPRLALAGPNPFTREARLTLDLAIGIPVHVAVFDAAGRQVRTIANGWFAAGRHPIAWDGRDDHGTSMPGGIYFVRALTGTYGSEVKRIVKVR
jgi:photosystem II stability/assembly factor-like uncharacterized protein